jgi:integrase
LVPARAQISPKRWANIRSDLAAAIDASGLRAMLKTSEIRLDDVWKPLLANTEPRIARGLSRFARWASQRQIAPQAVDLGTIERFVADLADATLVRKLRYVGNFVSKRWNELVASSPACGLRPVSLAGNGRVLKRIPWQALPGTFRDDLERYLEWASMPDPLADGARARALSHQTLRLQREHIHSAVSAAIATGVPVEQLTSLSTLVQPEAFRAVLGHLWQQNGRKLSAYSHAVAITLIAIAAEWVKAPADTTAMLKALRSKLGKLPPGLTEKNKGVLRTFDDPRLITALVQLPDRLWRAARHDLTKSHRSFTDLQSALAIDLLIHVPLRMKNLCSLNFTTHFHWPQGRRRPALVTFKREETKNDVQLEFEIPTVLAERLYVYRNEIAPAVVGQRPDIMFVTKTGKPRSQAAIAIAIQKTVLRYLGVKLTPHQFRHLAAKIILDANPGAFELVRQVLGHTNPKTTTSFYAGIDTRRAGRAHADLILKLRESKLSRKRHYRTLQVRED